MVMRLAPHFAPRFRTDVVMPTASAFTLPITGYRQVRNYTCGYACTLMVLRHFDVELEGESLFQALGTDIYGTSQTSIISQLRKHGLRVNVRYDMNFSLVEKEVRRGRPLICYLGDIEHWVVVYGACRTSGRLFVADPRPQEPCVHLWSEYGERLGGFALVCSQSVARVEEESKDQLSLFTQ